MPSERQSQIDALQAENARLKALLEKHGIDWEASLEAPIAQSVPNTPSKQLSSDEKIAIFQRLFRGRTDIYSVRWESQTSGKSGYTPACANEWKPNICIKAKTKCSECQHRLLLPLTDKVLYDHLIGKQTIGIYPLLENDTCYFLAVDFDDMQWQEDAQAFMQSCDTLNVPACLEISRSGQGAHVWIFFASAIPARDARRLGTAIISYTCTCTRQLTLSSYDRLFPNQDTMPKGGFGNLIALPLQKGPRERGYSIFVNTDLRPYPDQWAMLASIPFMSYQDIESTIMCATGNKHPLDVAFIEEEDLSEPWEPKELPARVAEPVPKSLSVTLSDQIYFEKNQLPQSLINRLIRLAAFQNPEFYKAQAMRFPVWDKPRVIGCAQNYPQHIALPRGCLNRVIELLSTNKIEIKWVDKRIADYKINIQFTGTLREDQNAAIAALLKHDTGVLCAPTGFGKTITAAALIAKRSVNTLILVHRTELLRQWLQQLHLFLDTGKEDIGIIGGGKAKPSGQIDIAVVQSLSRKGEVNSLIKNYSQIIVDECHHVGSATFSDLLNQANAKYVLGLTATPTRRDGLHPIIFMQCGPIRHRASSPQSTNYSLEVIPRQLFIASSLPHEAEIQEVFRYLTNDHHRTAAIVQDIEGAYAQGRKVLVLTERTDHLISLHEMLKEKIPALFLLHGRMSKKQRTSVINELNELKFDTARVLLSIGKLVGEGFDHPPLDTLILAMPISWKGTLQQYAGRLHREYAMKSNVRIFDYIDSDHPTLLRMWGKRQRGYRAMGYHITGIKPPLQDNSDLQTVC